ncbi:MAG: TetR/AcrR family transcriptional regulator [Sphingobium sp.]|nr:TetR/AcrR family transcriptional regulator [Sphingobium sp.]
MKDSMNKNVQDGLGQDDNSKHRAAASRKAAFVRETRALIASGGVEAVSLNEVLRLAGGSKATVVKYYGNRAGLIAAAIEESARELMQQLILTPDGKNVIKSDIKQSLSTVLTGLLQFYLMPDSLSIYRAVITARDGSGNLAESFYRTAQQFIVSEFAAYLNNWLGRGLRPDLDCMEAASQLTHMVRAGLYERVLLGIEPSIPNGNEIAKQAEKTAHLFLHGAAG